MFFDATVFNIDLGDWDVSLGTGFVSIEHNFGFLFKICSTLMT
jgi:hypothetical protein